MRFLFGFWRMMGSLIACSGMKMIRKEADRYGEQQSPCTLSVHATQNHERYLRSGDTVNAVDRPILGHLMCVVGEERKRKP